jgi:hypothetical protein
MFLFFIVGARGQRGERGASPQGAHAGLAQQHRQSEARVRPKEHPGPPLKLVYILAVEFELETSDLVYSEVEQRPRRGFRAVLDR